MGVYAYKVKRGGNRNHEKYMINFKYKNSKGVFQTKTIRGFSTRKEAEMAEQQIKRDMSSLQTSDAINMTIQAAFDYMINFKTQKGSIKDESTIKSYRNEFKKMFGAISDRKLATFDSKILQLILDEEMKKTSGIRAYKFMISFFNFCKETGLIAYNPTKTVFRKENIEKSAIGRARAEKSREKIKHFSKREQRIFYTTVEAWETETSKKIILLIALETGLRKGELRGLKWDDIDFNSKLISVDRQINNSERIILPKGKKKRKVPFSRHLASLLQSYKEEMKEQSKIENRNWSGSDWIFHQKHDWSQPITKDVAYDWMKKFYRENPNMDIPILTPHNLRHTYASNLFTNSTLDIKQIMVLMGHSSFAITEKYYLHFKEEDYEELARGVFPNEGVFEEELADWQIDFFENSKLLEMLLKTSFTEEEAFNIAEKSYTEEQRQKLYRHFDSLNDEFNKE